ncbi:histidinol dehydrogenase [Polyangium mundeleinium]|uniref:Histidinol dehydrogenase n=1 Tax=Polyangium mundeleinium TaxID=2995306 RepID=A0ABT5EYX3_9BACT|nr:histidinol dehydrogenase [Polyangium mundeleinium]MDC0747015.1 histidinol dehydrogenase [Polyangium mundeleinium]
MIPIHIDGTETFVASLGRLVARGADDLGAVEQDVRAIVSAVRAEGDEAVFRYVERFERRRPDPLVIRAFDGAAALARLEPDLRAALELAADRIRRYHEHQRETGFRYEEDGVVLGMRVRPLARVGVYAPGGKARYPSSVLMSAIPARVAGVRDIVLATPAPDDRLLAAAHLAGVTSILDAGGAQAIAALAYGTASLPRVDKIVGPGNIYVACAKKLVYGDVDIDGIAGPSEIVALADDTADPAIVAADLLSQAEHDEAAWCVLVTTSRALAEAVVDELRPQLAALSRDSIAGEAMRTRGVALVVPTLARLAEIASLVAGEHVAYHVADPEALFDAVEGGGAALLGGMTPVAAGDYLAGPSHVLPTGGAARFGSPLGVYDFVVRASIIQYATPALLRHGPHIVNFARAEGLDAHARAVELRISRHTRLGGRGEGES